MAGIQVLELSTWPARVSISRKPFQKLIQPWNAGALTKEAGVPSSILTTGPRAHLKPTALMNPTSFLTLCCFHSVVWIRSLGLFILGPSCLQCKSLCNLVNSLPSCIFIKHSWGTRHYVGTWGYTRSQQLTLVQQSRQRNNSMPHVGC